jgi:hypothetical protein
VPGLDLDIRTKPPKRDLPIRWQANALLPLQCTAVRPMRGYRQPQYGFGENVAMSDRKWTKLDEVRQPPGIRRVLDPMRQIEEEAPGLLDEAMSASIEFAKRRDGGHVPQ